MTCSSLLFSLHSLLTLPYYLKHSFQPQPQNKGGGCSLQAFTCYSAAFNVGGEESDSRETRQTQSTQKLLAATQLRPANLLISVC